MNHIKTMLCGHFIGIDKLERLKLLQGNPLVNEFDISVKEPETVSRFLSTFSYKTTHMFSEIKFKVFKKPLGRSNLKSITIDIDSSVINVEGHQEGTTIQKSLATHVTTSNLLFVMNSRPISLDLCEAVTLTPPMAQLK
jgi:hypothetical protein